MTVLEEKKIKEVLLFRVGTEVGMERCILQLLLFPF